LEQTHDHADREAYNQHRTCQDDGRPEQFAREVYELKF
jgi:ribosomal protein S14